MEIGAGFDSFEANRNFAISSGTSRNATFLAQRSLGGQSIRLSLIFQPYIPAFSPDMQGIFSSQWSYWNKGCIKDQTLLQLSPSSATGESLMSFYLQHVIFNVLTLDVLDVYSLHQQSYGVSEAGEGQQ